MEPKSVQGGCFCGAIRFEIEPPVLFCGHCHCSMCRRAHGAGYVTWFAVPYARFKLHSAEDRLVRFRSSDHGTRSFCATCGSTLFCESTRHPDWIDIVLANLDDSDGLTPQGHYYFDSRADWVRIGDELPRFGGKTGIEPL